MNIPLTKLHNPQENNTYFRFANTAQDRIKVGRLRYQVYIEELRIQGLANNTHSHALCDSLDKQSYIVMAEQKGKLIGTGRITLIENPNHTEFAFLELEKMPLKQKGPVAIATRFAVVPEFRGTSVFYKLTETLYQKGLQQGASSFVVFCYHHLIPTMETLGFRPYRGPAFHRTFGRCNPMYLPTNYRRLRELRSPLARAHRNFLRLAPQPVQPRRPKWKEAI